ncbi:LytR C-terminal domain-containing protein [Nesterenkonia muleiensis]|uniref:LytR C-terminal domain-containing protein n=1 Tax=Nesterenkonia muleiensis TaxID=2282648 RepID=UPI00130084BC|nr:LytR C-terminal domain-containing protein [Nesterenkonia muleiensis]
MSQFPHDDFDEVPPYRQDEVGKHRAPGAAPAGGATGSSGVAKWIGLLVVAVLVIVAVGWFVTRDGDDGAPVAEEENGQEEADPDEENGDNGAEGENGEDGENGAEEEPGGGLSDEHPVRAVNAGAPDGSAGQLTSQLQELGLDVGQSLDWNFAEWSTPTTPQVIYPEDEQQELAEAIAAELGIDTVSQNESWSTIVVVIGPEYE